MSLYMTGLGVLHTARINTIEVIMSSDRLIKMVNFKLSNEMWRWVNQHDTSVGQRKKRICIKFRLHHRTL